MTIEMARYANRQHSLEHQPKPATPWVEVVPHLKSSCRGKIRRPFWCSH